MVIFKMINQVLVALPDAENKIFQIILKMFFAQNIHSIVDNSILIAIRNFLITILSKLWNFQKYKSLFLNNQERENCGPWGSGRTLQGLICMTFQFLSWKFREWSIFRETLKIREKNVLRQFQRCMSFFVDERDFKSTLNSKYISKTKGVDVFLRKKLITFERSFLIGQPIRAARYVFLEQDFCLNIWKLKPLCSWFFVRHQIYPVFGLKMRPVLLIFHEI